MAVRTSLLHHTVLYSIGQMLWMPGEPQSTIMYFTVLDRCCGCQDILTSPYCTLLYWACVVAVMTSLLHHTVLYCIGQVSWLLGHSYCPTLYFTILDRCCGCHEILAAQYYISLYCKGDVAVGTSLLHHTVLYYIGQVLLLSGHPHCTSVCFTVLVWCCR